MRLLIMRHGEAESPFSASLSDADRQLTAFGQKQTLYAGEILQQQLFMPDALWVSPYLRAQQTADNVIQSLGQIPLTTVTAITPEGSPSQVIDLVQCSQLDTLMLVSHQPLVANLVAALTGLDVYAVPSMAPASMVLLEGKGMLPGLCDVVWHRHSPEFIAQH